MEQIVRKKYGNAVVDAVIARVRSTSYSEAYGYYETHSKVKHLQVLELLQNG